MENKIKELRKEKRLSQAELSLISGISRVTISSLERGKYDNVTINTMYRLAAALNVKIEDLFFRL